MEANYLQHLTNQSGLDYLYKVASLGLEAPNIRITRVTANTGNLAADSTSDIWESTGTKTMLTTASLISTVSSSTSDTAAGIGARTLRIDGLDSYFNPISETVTLNGTTPVVSTVSFIRVFKITVTTAGSSKCNVGNVTSTAVTGSSVQGYMMATNSASHMTHYTVPKGYTAIVPTFTLSIGRGVSGAATRTGTVNLFLTYASGVKVNIFSYDLNNSGAAPVQVSSVIPSPLPEYTDFNVVGLVDQNNTVISLQYEILLIKGLFNQNTVY